MRTIDHNEVIGFIGNFKGAEETFTSGCCYWFADILQGRFDGEIMYEAAENHFVCRIGGRLYDVTGDVTGLYGSSEALVRWEDMAVYDSSLQYRIWWDCVLKLPPEDGR